MCPDCADGTVRRHSDLSRRGGRLPGPGRGQREAVAAIGLRSGQAMRLVVLPQAIRRMLPTVVSQLVTLLKDSSLGFVLPYEELLRRGRSIGEIYPASILQVLLVVAGIYLCVNVALSALRPGWSAGRAGGSARWGPFPTTPVLPDVGHAEVAAEVESLRRPALMRAATRRTAWLPSGIATTSRRTVIRLPSNTTSRLRTSAGNWTEADHGRSKPSYAAMRGLRRDRSLRCRDRPRLHLPYRITCVPVVPSRWPGSAQGAGVGSGLWKSGAAVG